MAIKVVLGSDHAGLHFKKKLIKQLQGQGFATQDIGPFDDASVDYPDFVHPVAQAVQHHAHTYGIVICGSGNGVAMAANKHAGIRAALCWNETIATLARQHNNANILCLPARFVSYALAEAMVHIFLHTDFEGGRHLSRVKKINI